MLLGVGMGVYQLIRGEVPKGLLGLAAPLFLLVPPLLRRFLTKDPHLLYIEVFAFCILAYDFGCVLQVFDNLAFFDKISHFLSGFVFTTLGVCLYLWMTAAGPRGLRRRWAAATSYGVFFSCFVAILWEVCEFLGFVLMGHDSQHHLTTGVFDTMGDLIACLLGSLLCALALALYFTKRIRLVSAAVVEEFAGCVKAEAE